MSRKGSPADLHRRKLDKNSSKRRKQLDRIYARDNGICQICLQPCSREDATREHLKALKNCKTREEARSDNNIVLAHADCNNFSANPPNRYISGSIVPIPMTQTLAEQLTKLGLHSLIYESD